MRKIFTGQCYRSFFEEMSVPREPSPQRTTKRQSATKAARSVKRLTFDRSAANPVKSLYVSVPKAERKRGFCGWLAGASPSHRPCWRATTFLVTNITRALVGQADCGVCRYWPARHGWLRHLQDLFLPDENRDNMGPEGIQSEDLCQIRSSAGNKKTSVIAAERQTEQSLLEQVSRQPFDHEILADLGVFYPQAL